MSERKPDVSPSASAEKDEPSVLDREAKHVKNIAKAGDADQGGSALEKQEKVLFVEQDAKVEQTRREARETGAGTSEPQEQLNQDG